MNLTLYADGSGELAGGPGGWAAIIIGTGTPEEYSGSYPDGTSQTMELAAIYEGLSRVPDGSLVEVVTDSQNSVRWLTGVYRRRDPRITGWCHNIEELIKHKNLGVTYTHIRGHAGNAHNERADRLAGKARREAIGGQNGQEQAEQESRSNIPSGVQESQ